jgi:hypothetical protein
MNFTKVKFHAQSKDPNTISATTDASGNSLDGSAL